jgi:hypothetical protein
MKGKILFKEEQSFVGTWMWYLVLFITLSTIGFMISLLFRSESKEEAVIGLIISVIVTGAVLVLFTVSKLILTIDSKNIYYRYPPFVNKERKLTKSAIESMGVRTYSPIMEYGGYGYRLSFKHGRALNISGDVGLQLIFKDDKRLLIGTKMPKALNAAIEQLQLNWENLEEDA